MLVIKIVLFILTIIAYFVAGADDCTIRTKDIALIICLILFSAFSILMLVTSFNLKSIFIILFLIYLLFIKSTKYTDYLVAILAVFFFAYLFFTSPIIIQLFEYANEEMQNNNSSFTQYLENSDEE